MKFCHFDLAHSPSQSSDCSTFSLGLGPHEMTFAMGLMGAVLDQHTPPNKSLAVARSVCDTDGESLPLSVCVRRANTLHLMVGVVVEVPKDARESP